MKNSNRIIIGNRGQERDNFLNQELKSYFSTGTKICAIATSFEFQPTYDRVASRFVGFNALNITTEENAIKIDEGFDLFLSMALAEPASAPLLLVLEDINRLIESIKEDSKLLARFNRLINLAYEKKIFIWMVAQFCSSIEDIDPAFNKTLDRTILLGLNCYNRSNETYWADLCKFLKIKEDKYSSALELAGKCLSESPTDMCIYQSSSKIWKPVPIVK